MSGAMLDARKGEITSLQSLKSWSRMGRGLVKSIVKARSDKGSEFGKESEEGGEAGKAGTALRWRCVMKGD